MKFFNTSLSRMKKATLFANKLIEYFPFIERLVKEETKSNNFSLKKKKAQHIE